MIGPARYLLRIDDMCPAMSRDGWTRCRKILDEFCIHPILAVVPDNRDPALMCSDPHPDFWEEMNGLEAGGAAIALHGYRHLCKSPGRSLIPVHEFSEFSGVGLETQREWIGAGIQILIRHGLTPRLWVAPRHGFDRNTLRALREAGILFLSDGFAQRPFERFGLTWLPQQLWSPSEKRSGVWTICVHPNTMTCEQLAILRRFIRAHADQFISFDQAIAIGPRGPLSLMEYAIERYMLCRLMLHNWHKSRFAGGKGNHAVFPVRAGRGRDSSNWR